MFSDQLVPIPDEDKIDIAAFLRRIRDHHLQPRVYTPDAAALIKFEDYKEELKRIVETSNRGCVF